MLCVFVCSDANIVFFCLFKFLIVTGHTVFGNRMNPKMSVRRVQWPSCENDKITSRRSKNNKNKIINNNQNNWMWWGRSERVQFIKESPKRRTYAAPRNGNSEYNGDDLKQGSITQIYVFGFKIQMNANVLLCSQHGSKNFGVFCVGARDENSTISWAAFRPAKEDEANCNQIL